MLLSTLAAACAANDVGIGEQDEPESERPTRDTADAGDLPIRPDVGGTTPTMDASPPSPQPDTAAEVETGLPELPVPIGDAGTSDDIEAVPPDTVPEDAAETEPDLGPETDADAEADADLGVDADAPIEGAETLTFVPIELPETGTRVVPGQLETRDFRAARPTGGCTSLAEDAWIDGYTVANPGTEAVTLRVALRTGLDDTGLDLFGGNVVFYGEAPVPETLVPCLAAGVATATTTGTLEAVEVPAGGTVHFLVTGVGEAQGTYALDVTRADGGVAPGGIDATDIVLGPGTTAALPGALAAGDAQWTRPSERCTVFGSSVYYVDAYRIINPTPQRLVLDVIVETEWGGLDAYLHVYDGAAADLGDLDACFEGIDDDTWDYDDAALLDRVLAPNTAVYLLVSSWASGARGNYVLRVVVTETLP